MKNKEKKKKKRSLLATFLRTVLFIVLIFCAAAAAALFVYDKWFDGNDSGFTPPPILEAIVDGGSTAGQQMNIAVFGVDGGETRTDVIFVLHVDTKAKTVNLLSVPRDTYVKICPKAKQIMDDNKRSYPTVCKINEVHAYAGKEHGPECSIAQLDDLLGISIDHYIKINLEGFKKIVDAIGGVECTCLKTLITTTPIRTGTSPEAGPQTRTGTGVAAGASAVRPGRVERVQSINVLEGVCKRSSIPDHSFPAHTAFHAYQYRTPI